MNYRLILAGALLVPTLAWAQTPQAENKDSVVAQDLTLVGVIDASELGVSSDDDENSSQDVNTTVLTSHDVYLNKVGYQLSNMRFRVRGYESLNEERFINGVSFNDQLRGVFNYSSIGAINDLTRNGDETNYSMPGVFTFGGLGGAENILMRAGDYNRGGKATLTFTNRNYYTRAMLSYSTGLSNRGWAFTALIGGRYADEGNVDGTFYNNASYAFLLEKRWKGGKHSLTFATFGSPVKRGQGGSGALKETYKLIGDYQYNSNWGFQNGKKRNARVITAYDPTGVLAYEWKISPDVKFNAGVGVHYSLYSKTSLNWYDGADPRPDYYRYLPSYFQSTGNYAVADLYADLWHQADPSFTQINWDRMINANRNNVLYGDGSAVYMVEDRISNLFETTFNATIDARLNRNHKITAGVVARTSQSQQYKKADDLLGAEYLLDIDKYAEQDYPGDYNQRQMDLNRPNRKVYEGGIFGYDFNINIKSIKGWIVNRYNSSHWDAYYGAQLTYTDFQRDGKMRNGHFPNESYGKGKRFNFTDIMLKGGLTYKFNGRHLLQFNATYGNVAPLPNDLYISPRTSDRTPEVVESGKIMSFDLSYIFGTPKLQGRISLYETHFDDQLEHAVYYDNDAGTLVNYVMTGVKRIHRGVELGLTSKLDDHWSVDLAGTVSEAYYANNPTGYIYADNGQSLDVPYSEKVYMKNVYVGGVPQFAGTFGLRYFIDYWFLGANFNAFGRNYVQASPGRRTASKYNTVNPYDEKLYNAYKEITSQERFGTAYTIDLSVGKIIYLGRNSLNFNLTVNNLLNRRHIIVGGYEQGRMDINYPDRYKSKVFYMQGFNFFFNVSYRF